MFQWTLSLERERETEPNRRWALDRKTQGEAGALAAAASP